MTPIVLAAAVACLPPDSPITAEAECFFGSRLTAIRALSTASRESGCTLSDTGDCICPAEPPARDVCDNWAVRVVASYRPSEADAFIGNLTAQLGEACKTYGGKVSRQRPPPAFRAQPANSPAGPRRPTARPARHHQSRVRPQKGASTGGDVSNNHRACCGHNRVCCDHL